MHSIRALFELSPFNEDDVRDFPFFVDITLMGNTTNEVLHELREKQQWLTINIGPSPMWVMGDLHITGCSHVFQILFKHPEDVIAFKLRWL